MKKEKEYPLGKDYVIPFAGLSAGVHEFEFEVNKKFFDFFNNPDCENGTFLVTVKLTKQSSMLILEFGLKGHVNVLCDRCGEDFSLPVEATNQLVVKIGGTSYEEEDVVVLSSSDSELDIAQYIYEFIILDIPSRKVHPADENGNTTCNPATLEKLNKISVKENKQTDERWDQLKKFNIN